MAATTLSMVAGTRLILATAGPTQGTASTVGSEKDAEGASDGSGQATSTACRLSPAEEGDTMVASPRI